ncbi:MAG: 50S ribosomal protein L10 [Candidatus Krumholzibacteria bacterium]|jgi:large subunit ribosomal protein L10|nr:50S ribosomal protein L10 [Candidatus Krumholzibacteria bacterium]MDP6669480.1 50S ribosomal protein L10 [Candidatus Krumholzibacteria bacterium]MDP6798169.1 50S ribosomal protein L10 [Candidatus Krumholzibacteria bacterium]MDP7022589.1 50S ribosomal protein L10 [Candidatus Krumholzibacteria bacterium]
MPNAEKVALVETIATQLEASNSLVLCDFMGIDVAEISELRKRCRESGVTFQVIKNTLLSRAAEKAGMEGLGDHFAGPTAVAYSDDFTAPAKVLRDFQKEFQKLSFKGGYVDGQAIDASGVEALASLPGRKELLGMVVGTLQAPISGLARVLNANLANLVNALDQIAKQKENAA